MLLQLSMSSVNMIVGVDASVREVFLGSMMVTNHSAGTSDKSRLLARYAWLLDSSIRLPFGRRIGLDGIIGLIPGIGDGIGAILSSALIFSAWRMGVPPAILLRMAGNIAIDTAVGTIPIVGDLFDFAFKANQRNVQLLQRFEQDSSSVQRQSFRVLAVTGLVTILLLTALVTGVIFAGIALAQLLAGR
ncbi:MAG: DUF4112 domain-containing protein [Haliea sp.]